jgi:hypothetical protein
MSATVRLFVRGLCSGSPVSISRFPSKGTLAAGEKPVSIRTPAAPSRSSARASSVFSLYGVQRSSQDVKRPWLEIPSGQT